MAPRLRKFTRTFFWMAFVAFTTLGFRVLTPRARWAIEPADPKVWVKFNSSPAIEENDLDASDPLYGQVLDVHSAGQQVFDDYNAVTTSFFRLYDADTDPAYDPVVDADRTIHVTFKGLGTGESGHAGPTVEGQTIVGCEVALTPGTAKNANGFEHVLAHEIGHCAGLDHPQETTHSIMSYFGRYMRKLQNDDKAGLSYLYPADPSLVKESATLGFSCAPHK